MVVTQMILSRFMDFTCPDISGTRGEITTVIAKIASEPIKACTEIKQ